MIKYAKGQVWYYKDPNIKITYHNPTQGSVQSGTRPVVIVSNNIGNKHSSICMVIPCTSKDKKELPTHFNFYINDVFNTAMCEQIFTVPQSALVSYIGVLENSEYSELDSCLKCALAVESQRNSDENIDDDKIIVKEEKPVKTQICASKHKRRSAEEKTQILLAYSDARSGKRTMQSIVDEYGFSCYSSLSSAIHNYKKQAKQAENLPL